MAQIQDEIKGLRKEKKAVILAHNYQRPEIQDIADFVGDSLGLSREAHETDAEAIVFCGVDFMAETAAILNPDKKVLLPDLTARCPMAMMLTRDELVLAKEENPDAEVVLYINTSAETKAEADCICTSANAAEVINSMESDTVLFGPDKNLAYYVRKRSKKNVIPVPKDGICPTHHQLSREDVKGAMKLHPDAKLVVHPETIPDIQDLANEIASTEGMINYCKNSDAGEFLIGTENGIIHRMEKEIPGKKFYPISDGMICPSMKIITLEKLRGALLEEQYEILIPEEIATRARKAIQKMLEL